MEVILLESFNKLGKIGDIVNVKDGFARNYLIPQKKALRANKVNKEHFTTIKNELIEKNNKVIEEAKESLKKILGEEIIFIRNASDNGQLYGSVSPKDISSYFNQKEIDIKPSNINLHSAIKKVGIYSINIKLHAEVTCDLKINVATSPENANEQKNELNKSNKSNEDINDKENKVSIDDEINDSEKKVTKSNPKKSSDDKKIANTESEVLTKDEKTTVEVKSDKDEEIKTKNKNKPDSNTETIKKSESLIKKEELKSQDKSEKKEK